MGPGSIVTSGAQAGLRLGRGTADRVMTLAGRPLGRVAAAGLGRARHVEPKAPATFTPSRRKVAGQRPRTS